MAERAEELERLRAPPLHRCDRVHARRRDDATTDRLGRIERVSEVDVDMLSGSIFEIWAGGDFQELDSFPPPCFLTR
jgi:hypothetical protein